MPVRRRGTDAARRVARRASSTADIVCTQRAAEALRPPATRLLDDRFASHFVQARSYRMLCARPSLARVALAAFDRLYGGFHAEIMLRSHFLAEHLERALAGGVDQVVNLGAG